MEIPSWLNPYQVGVKMAEQWADSPSSKDPTKSNSEVIVEEIMADVQNGRSLSEPYFHPLREAARKGMVASAVAAMERKIEHVDLRG